MDLSTRTSRRRLSRSRSVRWQRLARGRSLGYWRASEDAGTWYVRVYVGGESGSPYRVQAIGTADDVTEADGEEILTYGEASTSALAFDPDAQAREGPGEEAGGPFTVGDAARRYLRWYKTHRRSYAHVRQVLEARVLITKEGDGEAGGKLGSVPVEELTADRIRAWHQAIADEPARLRGGQLRPAETAEQKRARKVSANRALSVLKAALNRAYEDGKATERARGQWQRVGGFRGVEVARATYLDSEELRRLLNACDGAFRDLVKGALYTGARYSELAALRVQDFRPESESVHFAKTKTGADRDVFLGPEAVAFFEGHTAGRSPAELMFTHSDGEPWRKNHQARRMRSACSVAGIEPAIGFHQLRHTYASLYLMSGGSLVGLSKQLGHTTTRMVEKHYGHLADSWRAEEAKKHAPSLGVKRPNVARLRTAKQRSS